MGTVITGPNPSFAAQFDRPQESPLSQIGQILALKNQMALAPLQQQETQQRVQSGQIELQQQQQAVKDQQAFRDAMADPSMQGKTLGQIADTLAKKGGLSAQTYSALKKADIEQRQSLATLDKDQLANMKAAHDQTQQLYNNIQNLPDEAIQAQWPQIVEQYNAIPGNQKLPLNPQQPMTKEQLKQFAPFVSMQNAYLDDALARSKAQTEAQTAQATLGQKQAETAFYQANGGAPGVSAELQQQADWLKKNPDKGPSDYKLWVMKNSPTAMIMGNQLGGSKNDDALDFAANNYRLTGQLPAGFARSPGTTSAIISRAAQLDQQAGGGGIAANKADVKSLSESLAQLQKNFQAVSAFENTANKNIDMLKGFAAKVPDLGTRFANTPIRAISGSVIGSENMAAFKTALAPVQSEAAKILNSANLTGTLSDTARKELQDIVDGNMPYKSLVASLNVLQQDFKNRHDSYAQQISDIQGRLKGLSNGSTGSNVSPTSQPSSGGIGVGAIITQNGHRYKVTAVDANGKPTAADPVQ